MLALANFARGTSIKAVYRNSFASHRFQLAPPSVGHLLHRQLGFNFCSGKITQLNIAKSPENLTADAEVFIVDKESLEKPTGQLADLLNDKTLVKDLKEHKSAWIYQQGKRYQLTYEALDYANNDKLVKSLRKLGASITRGAHAKKLQAITVHVPSQINPEQLAHFVSGANLANYKFEVKGGDDAAGHQHHQHRPRTYRVEAEEMTPNPGADNNTNVNIRAIDESVVNNNNGEKDTTGNNNKNNGEEASKSKRFQPLTTINIVSSAKEQIQENSYFNFLRNSSKYVLWSRELANTRANVATTEYFLEESKRVAYPNRVIYRTLKGQELEQEGLNLFYAVGKGSRNPPILVSMKYEGNPEDSSNVIAIVGKGLTFDAGGLNIKPTGSMETMYMDKAGACAVLAAFRGVVEMGLKVNLVCSLGLAENFISSTSYRPSDIITSLKGLTVEIGNTDAEGRLVLADTMTWTQRTFKPTTLIELSTLTGACMVALGNETAGLFSNDDGLAKELEDAGRLSDEVLWRLPIFEEHREAMKGDVADLNNAGKTRYGGACSAAAFLEKFVEKDVKWAHLDIAGPAMSSKDAGDKTKGCTGFGTSILLNYIWKRVQTAQGSVKAQQCD